MSCFEGLLEVHFWDDGFGEASYSYGRCLASSNLLVLFPGFCEELLLDCHYPRSQFARDADIVGGGVRSITLETASQWWKFLNDSGVVDATFCMWKIPQNPPHPCEQFPEFTFIDQLHTTI